MSEINKNLRLLNLNYIMDTLKKLYQFLSDID